MVLLRRTLIAGSGASVVNSGNLSGFINLKTAATPYEIWFISSTDSGASFTVAGAASISIGAGGTWDDVYVAHPSIVREGSTYAMYFSGYDGANWRSGRATNTALVATGWTLDPANPIIDLGSAGQPDDVGAWVPRALYDEAAALTRIWYIGSPNGTNFSVMYAERSSGGAITKYGEVMARGGAGTWYEVGLSAIAPHTIGGQKRLYLGGQAASGVSAAGWASYTDPRIAATYTNHGALMTGPFTISEGSFDSVAITDIQPRIGNYLIFGSLIHPTGHPGNQREVSFRSTSVDGLTISAPVGPVVPMTTSYPNDESRENPNLLVP